MLASLIFPFFWYFFLLRSGEYDAAEKVLASLCFWGYCFILIFFGYDQESMTQLKTYLGASFFLFLGALLAVGLSQASEILKKNLKSPIYH